MATLASKSGSNGRSSPPRITPLESALRYAELGYPVFPLLPGNKKPATGHGLKDASTDPATIKKWWAENPRYNVGIRCDGLLVLDLDGADNRFLVDKRGLDFEVCPCVRTPRGGKHYYFRQNGIPLKNSTSKLAPHVDTRADGGYVVAPPSIVDGVCYEWLADLMPRDELPLVPAWAETPKEECRSSIGSVTTTDVSERARKYLAAIPPAISGQGGHDQTFTAACALVLGFGLSPADAYPLLAEWNQGCQPPWLEKELRHKLDDANRQSGPRGYLLHGDSGWKERLNSFTPTQRANETPSKPAKREVSLSLMELLDFKTYPTETFPEPFRGLIRAGSAALRVDESFIGTAVLPVLASAIGNLAVIELKNGWTEPSILWAGFVGDSGTLKSPTLDLALNYIRARQSHAFAVYGEEQKTYELEKKEYDAACKQRKRGENRPAEPVAPICDRYYCSDVTIEALADRLSQAPRGLLVCRDELSGWFASFDAYRGGKGMLDISHWLGLYGARDLVVDRKNKEQKTLFVKRGNVSIVGGIQPEILRRSLTAESYDSGLVPRLLLCWPPKRGKRWTEATIDKGLRANVDNVFAFIYGITPKLDCNDQIEPYILSLTRDAKNEWVEFYNRHAKRQDAACGYEAAILSKIEGAAARLSLVIHFVRLATKEARDFDQVDADSFRAGVTLAEWYANENLRIHAVIHSGDGVQEQRELIEWIQQQGGKVTARHLKQTLRHYREGDSAEQALQTLVKAGFGKWIDSPAGPEGGRPTRIFRLMSLTTDNETPATTENF